VTGLLDDPGMGYRGLEPAAESTLLTIERSAMRAMVQPRRPAAPAAAATSGVAATGGGGGAGTAAAGGGGEGDHRMIKVKMPAARGARKKLKREEEM
jgi:hypothetical protein